MPTLCCGCAPSRHLQSARAGATLDFTAPWAPRRRHKSSAGVPACSAPWGPRFPRPSTAGETHCCSPRACRSVCVVPSCPCALVSSMPILPLSLGLRPCALVSMPTLVTHALSCPTAPSPISIASWHNPFPTLVPALQRARLCSGIAGRFAIRARSKVCVLVHGVIRCYRFRAFFVDTIRCGWTLTRRCN